MSGIVQLGDVPGWLQTTIGAAGLYLGLRARRQEQALDWARLLTELSGRSDEELRRLVEDNPALAELAASAWEAAAETASDAKRRLLATVVAAAMSGAADAEVEPLGFLLRTVIALEPAHVTLLVVIASPQEHHEFEGRSVVYRAEITARWSSPPDLLDPAVSLLTREGLVEQRQSFFRDEDSTGRQPVWCATPYGRRFLEFLDGIDA